MMTKAGKAAQTTLWGSIDTSLFEARVLALAKEATTAFDELEQVVRVEIGRAHV